jgi:hypothetical protein
MTFDRTNVRALSEQTQYALKTLADALGLSVSYKGGRFSSNNAVLKIEFANKSSDNSGLAGLALTREAETFRREAKLYGFSPDDLGKVFNSSKFGQVTITGLNPRAHRFPVCGTSSNGRLCKFPVAYVLERLGKKATGYLSMSM